MYTYKDLMTGKLRKTRGRFDGWTEPTGLLNVRYAKFRNAKSVLLIPTYLLTGETMVRIESQGEDCDQNR